MPGSKHVPVQALLQTPPASVPDPAVMSAAQAAACPLLHPPVQIRLQYPLAATQAVLHNAPLPLREFALSGSSFPAVAAWQRSHAAAVRSEVRFSAPALLGPMLAPL